MPKLHLSTGLALLATEAGLIWANATQTPLVRHVFSASLGSEPLARFLYIRGWPLAPCLICSTMDPARDPGCWVALAIDSLVAVAALFAVGLVVEWLARGGRLHVETGAALAFVLVGLIAANAVGTAGLMRSTHLSPHEHELVSRYGFLDGWPVSPWTHRRSVQGVYLGEGLGWHALAFDVLVAFLLLAGTGALVEWAIRKRRRAA